jgi:hypothetical protein
VLNLEATTGNRAWTTIVGHPSQEAATLSFFHCSRLLSRMLLLRSTVGLFRLCQRRRPSARVAGLLGVISFHTAGNGSIPAVRVSWRQRPLRPMSRRRVPLSDCPLRVTTRRSSAKSSSRPCSAYAPPSAVETARLVTCRDTTKCLSTGGNGPGSPRADEVAVGKSIRSGERSAAITPALVNANKKKNREPAAETGRGFPGG